MRVIRYRNPKTSAYLWHAFVQVEGLHIWKPLCGGVRKHAFLADAHTHPEFDLADNNPPKRILCPRCIRLFNKL